MSLNIGTKLGTFEIIGLLGKGGMGEVYRATDSKLGREVAIKVLPENVAQDEERLEHFKREAMTLASLDHSNEVTVHNVDVSANSGSISGIVYNAQTPFIFLYKGHRDVGSEAIFQDLHMLMTVEEIPVHFHSLSMFEFGNSTKNSSYQFSNLPDGTYTLAGATMVESPIMINGTRAPYIVQHITITNGEAIELDLGF